MMYMALLTELPTDAHPLGVEVSAPSYARTVARFTTDAHTREKCNAGVITFPMIPLGEDWGVVVGMVVYDDAGNAWAIGRMNRSQHLVGDELGGTYVHIPPGAFIAEPLDWRPGEDEDTRP